MENALAHGGHPSHVALGLSKAGGRCHLSVCDEGPGILEAERERVLARFTRGSHSRDTPGLGLRLSMAKAIAPAHGARLQIGRPSWRDRVCPYGSISGGGGSLSKTQKSCKG